MPHRNSTIGFKHEQIEVKGSIEKLTADIYKPNGVPEASCAFITIEGGPLRYTYDGSDPTSTFGHLLSDSDKLELVGERQLSMFKVTSTGDNTGRLEITYERD